MHILAYTTLLVLFIISELVASNCLYYLKREYIQSPKYDMCFRPHADMSFILNIFYVGRGMILFRLFRGVRTDVIKYLHAILTTGAIITNCVFIYTAHVGMVCFQYPFDNEYKTGSDGNIHWNQNHFKIGRILVLWGCLQILTGIVVFSLLRVDARRHFFGFHNTCGYFYYALLVTESSMKFFQHQQTIPDSEDPKYFCDWLMLQIFVYALIVLAILIIPHFEWPVVGSV